MSDHSASGTSDPSTSMPETNDWFCTKCGRHQGSQEAATRHHETCEDNKIWTCKACGREFSDYHTAEKHVHAHWERMRQNEGNVLRLLDSNRR